MLLALRSREASIRNAASSASRSASLVSSWPSRRLEIDFFLKEESVLGGRP